MPFGMGFGELVLVLVIVLVVFGSTKLPQLGDGLGRAIKNFKRSLGALNEIDVTPKREVDAAPPKPAASTKSSRDKTSSS